MVGSHERYPVRRVTIRCHVNEPRGLKNHLEAELSGIKVSALNQAVRYNNWICVLYLHSKHPSFLLPEELLPRQR